MNAKKIKARVMWAPYIDTPICLTLWDDAVTAQSRINNGIETATPVFVLPATREAYEQMVEQMAKAMQRRDHGRGYAVSQVPSIDYHRLNARAALAALNIKEPKP